MQGDAGLRPWEMWQLTIPELTLLLTEGPKRSASGGRPMTQHEINRYVEWFWSLPNGERLELARRGEL